MNKRQLIEKIYNCVSSHQVGFNHKGERVLEFENNNMIVRANLDQLTLKKLQRLQKSLMAEVV